MRRQRQAGPIVLLVFGSIFLVAGGAMIYFFGWPAIVEAKASEAWPATPGKITASRVESHRNKENQTMYSHHVEYTYSVDGTSHTGDRVWIGDGWSSSSQSLARQAVAQYPVGSETVVHYHPASPNVCALQTGTTWATYFLFGFGGLFFLIGALVAGLGAFKLAAGVLWIGAAATAALTKPPVAASPYHQPQNRQPPATDNDDDGISIT